MSFQSLQFKDEVLQLPNLRSLFPDLLESRASSPKAHSSEDCREFPDRSLFGCSKPGCNCDSNMLGDSINFFSKRERIPSISSASSSPLLATPQSDTAGLPLEWIRVAGKTGMDSPLSMPEPFSYLKESTGFGKEYGQWTDSKEAHSSAFQKYSRVGAAMSWEADTRSPFQPSPAHIHQSIAYSGNINAPTTIQKPYRCTYCNKRFARPSSLNTHVYSHTGEKPFECKEEGCSRRFSVLSNLRRHTKLHARSKRGSNSTNKSIASARNSESSAMYVGGW